jgi:hypothetical protein
LVWSLRIDDWEWTSVLFATKSIAFGFGVWGFSKREEAIFLRCLHSHQPRRFGGFCSFSCLLNWTAQFKHRWHWQSLRAHLAGNTTEAKEWKGNNLLWGDGFLCKLRLVVSWGWTWIAVTMLIQWKEGCRLHLMFQPKRVPWLLGIWCWRMTLVLFVMIHLFS